MTPYVEEENTTEATSTPGSGSALEAAEIYFLRQQNECLKKQLKSVAEKFTFQSIEHSDKMINFYTGIPTKDLFLCLSGLFENIDLNYFNGWNVTTLSKTDQMLLTLVKLKLNLMFDDLAFRFGISRTTASNIFKTWLYVFHEVLFLEFMKEVPSREKNSTCLPSAFSSFTNCRMVIDCTEISLIQSKNMQKQRATYSRYKHRNTVKGLIGVAPNGTITFASKLYPGSISDKKIVNHSKLLEIFEPGDLILADKGFLIKDMLPAGVNLNIPPFLTTPQFTPEQVVMTRTIAKARIHVERAIRRLKCFNILNMIPQTLVGHSSVIFQVCAALTNMNFPLIKEIEDLFVD